MQSQVYSVDSVLFHDWSWLILLQGGPQERGESKDAMLAGPQATSRRVSLTPGFEFSILLRSMATAGVREQKARLRKAVRADLAKLSTDEISKQCSCNQAR